MPASPDPYSFSDLLYMGRSELRQKLIVIVGELCTAIEHTAFVRSTDGTNAEYYEAQGHRDALMEQKWLLLRLLDLADG